MARIRQIVRENGRDITGWTPAKGRERGFRPPTRATWEVTVSLGRDVTGRYRQQTRRTEGTYTDAKELGKRMEVDIAGQRGSRARATLDEAITEYIAQREAQQRAPKTLVGYQSIAKRVRGYRPGGKAMVDLRLRGKLSSQDLDGYYRWLLDEGLSPATVAHHHAFLSQVLNQAVKWDWIGSPTAADKASPPALEQPDPDPPSVDDVRWLLNEFRTESEDLPALGFLAAQTGCRRGEVAGWRFEDFDVESGGQLRVMGAISDAGGKVIRKRTKTRRGRPMSLNPDSVLVFAYLLDRYIKRCDLLRITPDPSAYVFSQEPDHSQPWRPDRITHTWGRARRRAAARLEASLREAGKPEREITEAVDRVLAVKLKDLRSLSATTLLGSGVDPKTAAARLGHDAAVMLRHYAGVVKANDQAAADLLGAAIGGADLVLPKGR